MQKWRIAGIIMVMLCAISGLRAQTGGYSDRARQYVEQFRQLAIEEQRRSGVPAAITLAQGIHETAAGKSELAVNANNHFGIKCKKAWTGMTYKYTDDAPDECFRKYTSAEQSYKDHSDYLATAPRYASLFKLSLTDYAGWAKGLKQCGYATNPKYAQLLIKLVEDYKLQDYTYAAMEPEENPFKESAEKIKEIRTANNGEIVPNEDAKPTSLTASLKSDEYAPQVDKSKKKRMQVSYGSEAKPANAEVEAYVENPEKPEYGQLVKVNGLKAIYVKKGTVLLNEAFKYNIRYAKLLELNDLVDGPLEADMYVYLEKKNPRGSKATYVVKPGETISQIAQAEGIQLKFLKYYNHLGSNEEPIVGATLQLQQYTEDKPETYVKNIAPREEPAFAGSSPTAIPQGATRKRANYISKKDIANGGTATDAKPAITPKEKAVSIASETAVEEEEEYEDEDDVVPVQKADPVLSKAPESAPIAKAAIEESPVATVETTTPPVAEQVIPEASKQEPATSSESITKAEETNGVKEEPVLPAMPATSAELVEAKEVVAEEVKEVETEEKKGEVKPVVEIKAVDTAAAKATEVAQAPVEVEKTEEQKPVENETTSEPKAAEVATKENAVVEEPEAAEAIASTEPATTEAVTTTVVETIATPEGEVKREDTVAATTPTVEVTPVPEEPKEPEGPQDEFSRLKSQLDKVVYASDKIASTQKQGDAKEVKKEVTKPEEKKPVPTAAKTEESPSLYTVKKGDTAFSIAKKHKITVTQLNEWNKLDSKAVKIGQKLRVK